MQDTYDIGITRDFRQAVGRLDPPARAEVWDALGKVTDGYAAAHVHKLADSDFVSFSVNRNALRVVCQRDGRLLIAVHVAAHDDAYAWASRHRTVRVGRVVRILPLASASRETAPDLPTSQPEGPLAGVRDRVFQKFGVDPLAARALRRVADEDELTAVALHVESPLDEALLDLGTDPDDLPRILRTFEDARRADVAPEPVPLAEAARDTLNAGHIWFPSSFEPLREALDGSLDDWELFLHPSQEALVRRHHRGAAKVTGGPGTGKTVVALHRARFLAEHPPADDDRPVLLTTFGRTLTDQLATRMDRLLSPAMAPRVEVVSLVAVAQRVLRAAGRPAELLLGDAVDACWREALAHDTVGWSVGDYRAERELVLARNGAWTGTAYLTTARKGRTQRLQRATRRAVWKVLEAFEAALEARGGGDALALAREATKGVAAQQVVSPWRAVICDEVQDAGAAELRLLAALAREPGSGRLRADGLMLCGDGYQRIYSAPVSLVSCGIEVRGRSRRLRLNYRTTEGIRRAAIEVVKGLDPDALDTLDDGEGTALDGYRSVRGGPVPSVHRFDGEAEEAAWIAGQGAPLLVLVRTGRYRDGLAERLRAHGVAVHVLDGRGEVDPEGVTLCTLHRSKGLEAPRVVVAGRQRLGARFPGGDAEQRRAWERAERCLLYVGMTRARDWLAITAVGPAGA